MEVLAGGLQALRRLALPLHTLALQVTRLVITTTAHWIRAGTTKSSRLSGEEDDIWSGKMARSHDLSERMITSLRPR
jgi:hypothetical protein